MSHSIRLASRECGIAYGARALRRRSRRSTPRSGKPATWGRAAGVKIPQSSEVREMREAETVLGIIQQDDTGEPGTLKGVRPVRRGADRKVPVTVTRWPPTLLYRHGPFAGGLRRGHPAADQRLLKRTGRAAVTDENAHHAHRAGV